MVVDSRGGSCPTAPLSSPSDHSLASSEQVPRQLTDLERCTKQDDGKWLCFCGHEAPMSQQNLKQHLEGRVHQLAVKPSAAQREKPKQPSKQQRIQSFFGARPKPTPSVSPFPNALSTSAMGTPGSNSIDASSLSQASRAEVVNVTKSTPTATTTAMSQRNSFAAVNTDDNAAHNGNDENMTVTSTDILSITRADVVNTTNSTAAVSTSSNTPANAPLCRHQATGIAPKLTQPPTPTGIVANDGIGCNDTFTQWLEVSKHRKIDKYECCGVVPPGLPGLPSEFNKTFPLHSNCGIKRGRTLFRVSLTGLKAPEGQCDVVVPSTRATCKACKEYFGNLFEDSIVDFSHDCGKNGQPTCNRCLANQTVRSVVTKYAGLDTEAVNEKKHQNHLLSYQQLCERSKAHAYKTWHAQIGMGRVVKKHAAVVNKLDDYKKLMIAMSTKNIPRLHQLISQELKQNRKRLSTH